MTESIQLELRLHKAPQQPKPLKAWAGFLPGVLLVAMLLGTALAATPGFAEDEAPAAEASEAHADQPTEQQRMDKARDERRAAARATLTFDHWENGLDVKATSLFANSASSFDTPSMILTAQWNYRFLSETRLGVTLSGMPTRHSASFGRDYTTYYGGVNIGQAVFAHNQYRLVLNMAAGGGVLFIRLPQDPNVVGTTVQRPDFTFFEPGGYLTFISYGGLDIGITASYRFANLRSTVPPTTRMSQKIDPTTGQLTTTTTVIPGADNASISSANFGLTFRALIH